ncbi:hypothetical protein EWI07_00025 [Sporolactobacillus sp. THM7-4]|nr:hypothetical protein EWI07_00025 [Sporolactobacillus sp. THM7-4]
MVKSEQNARDRAFDPFTHFMFGSQLPPNLPPQEFYQNNGWQASGTQAPQQTPQGQPGFLKPFLDQNGHIDVGKVMNGANHFVSVINQTAPAVKQLSPLLKLFKKQ